MKLDTLHKRLAAAEAKLQRLNEKVYPTDELSKHFHLGQVGGSGKPVRKLNKVRERVLDQRIEDAKEIMRLTRVVGELKAAIARANQPKPEKKTRPRRASSPKKQAKPENLPTPYLVLVNHMMDLCDERIQVLREKFHAGAWNDPHDHELRGQQSVFIHIQAHLVGESFAGRQVTTAQLLGALDKALAEHQRNLALYPTSHYLAPYGEGLTKAIEEARLMITSNPIDVNKG